MAYVIKHVYFNRQSSLCNLAIKIMKVISDCIIRRFIDLSINLHSTFLSNWIESVFYLYIFQSDNKLSK